MTMPETHAVTVLLTEKHFRKMVDRDSGWRTRLANG
jgi:hypothetical protein